MIEEMIKNLEELLYLTKFINKYDGKKKDVKNVKKVIDYLKRQDYDKVFSDEVNNDYV